MAEKSYVKPAELFKTKDTIVVQPLTLEAVEKVSLWNNNEKKYTNEGKELVREDGKKITWDRYVKLTDSEKKYLQRKTTFERNVLLDNKEVIYGMPKTVNDKLVQIMDTLDKTGQDPLKCTYSITRKKTGPQPIDVEYEVVFKERVSNGAKSKAKVKPEITLEDLDEEDEEVELTAIEKKTVERVKAKYPDLSDVDASSLADQFVKLCNIKKDRATKIVAKFLKA